MEKIVDITRAARFHEVMAVLEQEKNMNFQLLLKDLQEVKSVIYDNTERAEELLDLIISEISIKANNASKIKADES